MLRDLLLHYIASQLNNPQSQIFGLHGIPENLASQILDFLVKDNRLRPAMLQSFISWYVVGLSTMADEKESGGMLPLSPVSCQGPGQACEVNEVDINVKCVKRVSGKFCLRNLKYAWRLLSANYADAKATVMELCPYHCLPIIRILIIWEADSGGPRRGGNPAMIPPSKLEFDLPLGGRNNNDCSVNFWNVRFEYSHGPLSMLVVDSPHAEECHIFSKC